MHDNVSYQLFISLLFIKNDNVMLVPGMLDVCFRSSLIMQMQRGSSGRLM